MTRSMSQPVRIPVICDVKYLHEAIHEWRRRTDNPGSELWTSLYVDHAYHGIVGIWGQLLDENRNLFPWRKELVIFLLTKIRKGNKRPENGHKKARRKVAIPVRK